MRSGKVGKFQIIAFVIIVMGMASTAFILYDLNFLELAPELEC